MGNNETPGGGRAERLSRRTFVSGTSALTAGAMLMGRMPDGTARLSPHKALTSGGNFSLSQTGPAGQGSGGTLHVTMPASSPGTLLVAALSCTNPKTPFSAVESGWQQAATAAGPAGRVEVWYYPLYFPTNGSPQPGNPGGVTFADFLVTDQTADLRGAMAEFKLPPGTLPVFDAAGQGGAASGSFSVTAASGNYWGDLGIAVAAGYFSTSTTGIWSGPAGWSSLQSAATGLSDLWASWYQTDLQPSPGPATGVTGPLSASLSASGGNGWAFAFAAFRAVAFQSVFLGGAEMTNCVACDPTGQVMLLGGDVEGMWRSVDGGDNWQPSQDGVYGEQWRCTASVAWSQLEPTTFYACVGRDVTTIPADGGFLASTDGGLTWTMRASAQTYPFLSFQANKAGTPLPRSELQDMDRSVGRLIAQDPTPGNSYLYVATYNGGVARSGDNGKTWLQIGANSFPGGLGNYYPRAIAINPGYPAELWVGMWNYRAGATGGVWHTTNANATDPTKVTWTQLPAVPAGNKTSTCADLKVLGSGSGAYLYAAFPKLGVFYYQISKGNTGTWVSMNHNPPLSVGSHSNGPQLWTGLDGYVSGSNHVIIAACGDGIIYRSNRNYTNVVQVTVSPAGSKNFSYVDLTGQATLNFLGDGTTPPLGEGWWKTSGNPETSWSFWLGGADFVQPHVLVSPVNPTTEMFITGAGGLFRTQNANASDISWDVAVSGAAMGATFAIATDPLTPNHLVLAGSDFAHIDLTDPTGFTGYTATTNAPWVPLPSQLTGAESHAVAIDPQDSTVYAAFNQAYQGNTIGSVYLRPATGLTVSNWTATGYEAGTNQSFAPIGLYAGRNAKQARFLLVATMGGGLWQATTNPSNGWSPPDWTLVNGTIGNDYNPSQGGVPVQPLPFAADAAAGVIYCFDRFGGVWRSNNYGYNHSNGSTSWHLIWNLTGPTATVADTRSGWISANPNSPGELWVAASNGLFKLTGANVPGATVANGQIKVSTQSTSTFPNGAGGLVFTTSGTLYAVALNGAGFSAQLLSLPNGGTSWTDAGGSGIGSYLSWPQAMAITAPSSGNPPTQTVLVSNLPNFYAYQVGPA